MKKFHLLFLTTFFILAKFSLAQQDTIITKDHTVLYGEIKEMSQAVLTFKTSYSKNDFKIEWLEVLSLQSFNNFRLTLKTGERYYGRIEKDTVDQRIIISDYRSGNIKTEIDDLVYLKQVNQGSIFDIMNLALDAGYSFTKTNNLHQLNGNLQADYYRKKWGVATNASIIRNVQDKAPSTKRINASIEFKLFLKNNFFMSSIGDYYSNDDQQLKLRSTHNLSLGQYLIHTNKVYLNYSVGIANTNENYIGDLPTTNNFEGTIKIEYNMFDLGDLNMFTNFTAYPSFTDWGRIRLQNKVSIKYDLPRDFYIKTSLDYSYDNKPVEGASADDYVFTTGIGWEL